MSQVSKPSRPGRESGLSPPLRIYTLYYIDAFGNRRYLKQQKGKGARERLRKLRAHYYRCGIPHKLFIRGFGRRVR